MNPKSLNRYAFVEGNPIRFTDPTGHFTWKFWTKQFWTKENWATIGIFIGLAALTVFTGGLGIIPFLAAAGALGFSIWATARGLSPTSSDRAKFWLAIAAGAVIGAAVGAMLAALPASIGFTGPLSPVAGFFVGLAADVLVGAVLGGLGTVVAHLATGGHPEDIFSEELGQEIATAVLKGAIFGLVTGGVLNAVGLLGDVGFAIAAGASVFFTLEGVWEIAKSGYAPNDKFSFLNVFGSDSNWFNNPSGKILGVGVQDWVYLGTWLRGHPEPFFPLLRTMPLAP